MTRAATPVARSTAPGGSSGQIQYNSGGAFAGAAALTYATSGTHLTATAQAGTVVPLAAQEAAGQTANVFEVRDSSGAARGGWGPQATATDPLALFFRPSGRSYYLGTREGGGQFEFGRSDATTTFVIGADDTAGVQFGILNTTSLPIRITGVANPGSPGIILAPFEGGGMGRLQIGRRFADSSNAVGAEVQIWPATDAWNVPGYPALAIMAPGGASYVAGFKTNGAIFPAGLADADAANGTLYYSTTAGKLVFKDSGGVVNNLY